MNRIIGLLRGNRDINARIVDQSKLVCFRNSGLNLIPIPNPVHSLRLRFLRRELELVHERWNKFGGGDLTLEEHPRDILREENRDPIFCHVVANSFVAQHKKRRLARQRRNLLEQTAEGIQTTPKYLRGQMFGLRRKTDRCDKGRISDFRKKSFERKSSEPFAEKRSKLS